MPDNSGMKIRPGPARKPRAKKAPAHDYGPPGPVNIVRFTRSLFPKRTDEERRCRAVFDAAFETLAQVENDGLRWRLLNEVLTRAYEELKQPEQASPRDTPEPPAR